MTTPDLTRSRQGRRELDEERLKAAEIEARSNDERLESSMLAWIAEGCPLPWELTPLYVDEYLSSMILKHIPHAERVTRMERVVWPKKQERYCSAAALLTSSKAIIAWAPVFCHVDELFTMPGGLQLNQRLDCTLLYTAHWLGTADEVQILVCVVQPDNTATKYDILCSSEDQKLPRYLFTLKLKL